MFDFLGELLNNLVFYYVMLLLTVIAFMVVLILFLKERKTLKQLKEDKILDNNLSEETLTQENDERESAKLELQKMLEQMQKDLESKTEEAIQKFEREQEEKAIISYQELLQVVNKENSNINYYNNHNIDNVNSMNDDVKSNDSYSDNYSYESIPSYTFDEQRNIKKFKNTDFISPIYGKIDANVNFPRIPKIIRNNQVESNNIYDTHYDNRIDEKIKMETVTRLDTTSLSNEIAKSEEFLRALKEFRNNL